MKRTLKLLFVFIMTWLIVSGIFVVSSSAATVTLDTPDILNVNCASAT